MHARNSGGGPTRVSDALGVRCDGYAWNTSYTSASYTSDTSYTSYTSYTSAAIDASYTSANHTCDAFNFSPK